MSHSNESGAAILTDTSARGNRPATRSRTPERLSVELDFARISHETESTSSHPHILFSPIHYEPGYAYPLLVWLHGAGGNERQVMRIMPILSMRNYVAVAPQGFAFRETEADESDRTRNSLDVASILRNARRMRPQFGWPDAEEGFAEAERRVFDCISIARQRSNIAANRIFLAGYGTGGTMALRLALLYPEEFAGVASLGGAYPLADRTLHCWESTRNLNFFLGVGATSDLFSPNAACRALELLHTAGVPVTAREYSCGRELVPAMLQDLNRWMMSIVCDGAV